MKIGVFQCAHGGLAFPERQARLEAALAANPVDLLVCPELFATGYNIGDELRTLAEPVDGRYFRGLSALAKSCGTAIVYGYAERGEGGIYNSAAFIGEDGKLLANHRKRLNSPNSFEEDYFSLGHTRTVAEWRGVKVGIVICYEFEVVEGVRGAAMAGAEIVAVPTALIRKWRPIAEMMTYARAFENGIWLAYANHAGHENGLDYVGCSRIVAPDGIVDASAGDGEALVFADYDPARTEAARARLPYLRDGALLSAAHPE